MGLLYGENCRILTTTVFAWITRVTDWQTDRRTDGRTDGRNCDSICALTAYAVARKNCIWMFVIDRAIGQFQKQLASIIVANAAMLNIFWLTDRNCMTTADMYISFAYVCDVYDITNENEMFYFILPHPVYVQFYYSLRHFLIKSYSGLCSFRWFRAVFVGYVIWFIFINLRSVSYLHHFSYFILLCSICRSKIFWQSGNIYSRFGHFSLCMRRNGIIATSGMKSCHQTSHTSTSYKSTKILAIWEYLSWLF